VRRGYAPDKRNCHITGWRQTGHSRGATHVQSSSRTLDLLIIWGAPLFAPVVILLAWNAGPEAFEVWVSSDTSVFEHTVGFILLLSLLVGIHALFTRDLKPYPGLRPWLIAWCLGIGFFLGEDMNWGQHIFGWQSPEFFLEHNKELETNLHNIGPWFNQWPRMVVRLWVLVAGFLVPLAWSWPRRATAKFVPAQLWPERRTMWLALAAVLVPSAELIVQAVFGPDQGGIPIRFSEIEEFFFAWFFLLYAAGLSSRLRRSERPDSAAARKPAE